MKTISLSVSEKDYELFREEAKRSNRSIASLIREAMAVHAARATRTESGPAADVATQVVKQMLPGPGKFEIYAEVREVD
jgi:hypothetical protein